MTTNNYEKLSNQDRLDLSIAAMVNGDLDELKILQDTCPAFVYSTADVNYFVPFQAIMFLSLVFSEICVTSFLTVQLKEMCLTSFEMSAKRYKKGITPEIINTLQEGLKENLLNLKAKVEGYRQFCDQFNLNFVDLLQISNVAQKCPRLHDYLNSGEAASLAAIEAAKEEYLCLFNNYRGILNVYH